MTTWIRFLLIALLFLSTPSFAQDTTSAEVVCGPVGMFMLAAEEKFGTKVVAGGIANDGAALGLLLVNAETGEWVWLVAFPNENAECVFASGEGWGEISPKQKGGL